MCSFRYCNQRVCFRNIFDVLSGSETIEKVWFESHDFSDLSLENLELFLRTGHNLVFVGLKCFGKNCHPLEKSVSELLKTYERLHPARYFRIGYDLCKDPLLPNVHFKDMACNSEFEISKISTIDAYRDFVDF